MRLRKHSGASVEAIEAEYRRKRVEYLRVAAAVGGSWERAEDVVQEAFAKAVRARRQYKGESPLSGWIARIVVNVARDEARRASSVPVEGDLIDASPGASSWVGTIISQLPERQRLVLFLRYYADMDYRTVAAAAGMEVGSVGPTLSAALKTLRRLMAEVETNERY